MYLPQMVSSIVPTKVPFYPIIGTKSPIFGADFINNRYTYNGADVALTSLLSTTRSTTKIAADTTGALTSFATNTPARTNRGLLVEEGRTNLLTYSQEFDNAAWTKSNCTISANAAVASDGTTTADNIVEDTATAFHGLTRNPSFSFSTDYTFSIRAKPNGRNCININFSAIGVYVVVNLATGAIVTSLGSPVTFISSTLDAYGYRTVGMKVTTPAAGVNLLYHVISTSQDNGTVSYTGDGASGITIWGAQLEAGAFPTSYTATTSSTISRSADDIVVSPIPTMTGKGTLFVEFEAPYLGTANFPGMASLHLSSATGNNRVNVYVSDGGTDEVATVVVTGGVIQSQNSLGTATTPLTSYRAAVSFDTNDIRSIRNGVAVQTDSAATMFVPDICFIGRLIVGSGYANTYIRRFYVYNDTFTNTELAQMVA